MLRDIVTDWIKTWCILFRLEDNSNQLNNHLLIGNVPRIKLLECFNMAKPIMMQNDKLDIIFWDVLINTLKSLCDVYKKTPSLVLALNLLLDFVHTIINIFCTVFNVISFIFSLNNKLINLPNINHVTKHIQIPTNSCLTFVCD